MSTKSKKAAAAAAAAAATPLQAPQSSSTPQPQQQQPTTRSGSRPGSSAGRQTPSAQQQQQRTHTPVSPTRQSRLQEKADLQNLNDRLAAYIDRVRHLETENSRLQVQVTCQQDTVTREVTNIKSMYERELNDARRLLDDTAREKAKLEIDGKRLVDENNDLRLRLDKKTKDLVSSENTARLLDSRVSDLNSKYASALAEKKKAADEAADLSKELEKLCKILADTRKIQEEETLCRIDLENTLQSLREELQFKDQIYQQELSETRTRRQVDISEIDGRLAQQYEAKLQQSLQELREQQEAHVRANREELEGRYDNKMKALQDAAKNNSSATGLAVEELRSARLQVDGLNLRISELESQNSALNHKCRDLEKTLQAERARHAGDLAQLEAELARLRDEMAEQLKEYATLMDIKTCLDLEIATYRKLLEGEEDRLNLTPGSPSGSMSSMRRGTPVRTVRKRMLLDESEERSVHEFSVTSSAKGDIEISDFCVDGTYVQLHNKGKKEVSLSGFQIVRRAGGSETNFKFHRSVKIEPNGHVTVWSGDAGREHDPPHNLVMKSQKWFIGDNMTTVVINPNGEEVAQSERQKRQVSTSQRHREYHKIPRHEYGSQLQQGVEHDEKCSIM